MKTTIRSLIAAVAVLSFAGAMSVSALDHHEKDKDKQKKEHSEAMKAKWDAMSDEEKAAHKMMKEKCAKLADEEKAACKKKMKMKKEKKDDT